MNFQEWQYQQYQQWQYQQYQYQQKINQIWSNMSVDEYGSVYMRAKNEIIKFEDLKYINKNGKNFIFDNQTQRLYDNMFNYYHNGRYYDRFGNLIQDVKDTSVVIDSDGNIINDPPLTIDTNPDIVDADFVDINNEQPVKKQKPKVKKGPKLKDKPIPIMDETFTEEKPVKKQKPKVKKGPKLKEKPKLTQKTKEPIKQVASSSKNLPKKSLSGGGKAAIIAAATIIIGATIIDNNKDKNKKTKAHHLSRSTNSEEIDNSYAQQMAADISSYRYGKHITGFVNF